MRKRYLILILLLCFIMTVCKNTQNDNLPEQEIPSNDSISQESQEQVEEEKSGTESAENESYEKYSGIWTLDGMGHDQVISQGGTEFSIKITNKTDLKGYLYSQQGMSERIAEIDNITGVIDHNESYYEFTEDGWGGTGTLHIQFLKDAIRIEVKDYKMDENNLSGFGISGIYQLKRSEQEVETEEPASEISEEELQQEVYARYYSQWSEDEMLAAIKEKSQYRESCSFYKELSDYMENVRDVKDVAYVVEPLFYTDMKYYKKQDFENVPALVLRLAKNEIYARKGYIFKNEDLNNYFMGQLWYEPSIRPEDFTADVFNDYERENLKLLTEIEYQR